MTFEDIKDYVKEHKRELVIGGLSATCVILTGLAVWSKGYAKGFKAGKRYSSKILVNHFIGEMEQALYSHDRILYDETMKVLEDAHVVRKAVKE